jgi:hypothetical protein
MPYRVGLKENRALFTLLSCQQEKSSRVCRLHRKKSKKKRFSASTSKNLRISTQKLFLSSRKYDPKCSYRMRIFTPPRSRGQKGTGSRSRIRNTAGLAKFLTKWQASTTFFKPSFKVKEVNKLIMNNLPEAFRFFSGVRLRLRSRRPPDRERERERERRRSRLSLRSRRRPPRSPPRSPPRPPRSRSP